MKQQLGKYTILAELGRGGFGTVYKAEDPIGRIVALKVLHPGWDQQPDVLKRFQREAMAGGSLFHQCIATILDIEETEGQLYLVMRYVDGKTLREELKTRGKFNWEEAKKIIMEVGEGLQAAHQAGFIHRDVKPENILLGREGAVLTDFGLTKAMETSTITNTKGVIGTYQYIAPEIWLGEEITPKVDVYSLACVLHEMVSGESLFKGDSAPAVMTQHLIKGPQIPERYPQGCPQGLGYLLKESLAKEADRRLTLQAFIEALQKMGIPETENTIQTGTVKEEKVIPKEKENELIKTSDRLSEPQAGQVRTIELGNRVIMEFVYVPAGEFWMGADESDLDAYEDEKPKHNVYLDAYWIGKYPVTNQQYACFIKETKHRTPDHWKNGQIPNNKEDHPVVHVYWNDAVAFTEWLSQKCNKKIKLPTEAQWEKAARGTDDRKYPWGNEDPNVNMLNFNENIGDTTPVGSFPLGECPYGARDMAGNVWEWMADWYDDECYNVSPPKNPTSPTSGVYRALRGGSWYVNERLVRSSYRLRSLPGSADYGISFRCAISD